jgi:hypothetical protein
MDTMDTSHKVLEDPSNLATAEQEQQAALACPRPRPSGPRGSSLPYPNVHTNVQHHEQPANGEVGTEAATHLTWSSGMSTKLKPCRHVSTVSCAAGRHSRCTPAFVSSSSKSCRKGQAGPLAIKACLGTAAAHTLPSRFKAMITIMEPGPPTPSTCRAGMAPYCASLTSLSLPT